MLPLFCLSLAVAATATQGQAPRSFLPWTATKTFPFSNHDATESDAIRRPLQILLASLCKVPRPSHPSRRCGSGILSSPTTSFTGASRQSSGLGIPKVSYSSPARFPLLASHPMLLLLLLVRRRLGAWTSTNRSVWLA
jgi:hypothetical protein